MGLIHGYPSLFIKSSHVIDECTFSLFSDMNPIGNLCIHPVLLHE